MINNLGIRNVAIIAHVDHGKTTLVDAMLRQTNVFAEHEVMADRLMDSGDLEKERGITILAKCTSIKYNNLKFNIVDTPGHADFGGEVERVLSMVDGVVLLVDASEGPMPQTKFVLGKALSLGLKPIVIINKIDRPDGRADEVLDEIYTLFFALDANDEQLDFPILYASGRDGWAGITPDASGDGLQPLFKLIESYIPAPVVNEEEPFSMLATILSSDPYSGRILIGKVYSGSAKVNQQVRALNLNGTVVEQFKLTKLFSFKGIERFPVESIVAGDIVAVAGMEKTSVADTICDVAVNKPLESRPVDPPTMSLTISVNNSPLAGRDGTKVTSSMILERLRKEAESNVAITLTISPGGESFEVGGRGELQLGVLIETMRREGFELSVSKPVVLMKKDASGQMMEPLEEVVIDVDDEYVGAINQKLLAKKCEMIDVRHSGAGKTRLVFHAPSRSLIGYQSEFKNDTRGTGVMSRVFNSYIPFKGSIQHRKNGVLIANSAGLTTAYSLNGLEDRGQLFVGVRVEVYEGMIVGEHNRENDLDVNPVRPKQLTNIRSAGNDENIKLAPPRQFTLEEVISYIEDDELVEVTPKNIRLRKKKLTANDRKRKDS